MGTGMIQGLCQLCQRTVAWSASCNAVYACRGKATFLINEVASKEVQAASTCDK